MFTLLSLSLSVLQQPSVSREVTRFMETGHWFISLYNDDGDEQEITFYAAVADDMTQNCPNGCSGNGQCMLGHCQCNPGFGGDDCSESKCLSILTPYHCHSPRSLFVQLSKREPWCEHVNEKRWTRMRANTKFTSLVSFSFIIPTPPSATDWFFEKQRKREKSPPKRFDECSGWHGQARGRLVTCTCVCVTSNIHKSKMFNEPRIMHMVYVGAVFSLSPRHRVHFVTLSTVQYHTVHIARIREKRTVSVCVFCTKTQQQNNITFRKRRDQDNDDQHIEELEANKFIHRFDFIRHVAMPRCLVYSHFYTRTELNSMHI